METDSGDEVEYAVSTGQSDQPERKPLFKMPNVREDLRLLPSILRSKPILFLPLIVLIVGLPLFVLYETNQISPDIAVFVGYYVQFFYIPPALFTFFIAGFFAPRASYLIGFIFGVLAGIIWAIGFIALGNSLADPTLPPVDNVQIIGQSMVFGIVYGTLAASLASWYREFLRGMQERGKARRADKEVDERAKRAAERQEARKVAKQRPTS